MIFNSEMSKERVSPPNNVSNLYDLAGCRLFPAKLLGCVLFLPNVVSTSYLRYHNPLVGNTAGLSENGVRPLESIETATTVIKADSVST